MHIHCWHSDENSRRRYKPFKLFRSTCKINAPSEYQTSRFYVAYKIDEFCCICGKRKVIHCEDADYNRGMSYPTEEEYLSK
jgi:hypothetical protein